MLLRSTTLLCVVAVMTAGTAYGGIEAGDFALGVDASLSHVEGATQLVGAAKVSWFAMAEIELAARVAGVLMFDDGTMGALYVGLDANYLFTPDNTFIPYVGAHVMAATIWGDGGSAIGFAYGGQAGCLFALDEHSHLRAEYRLTLDEDSTIMHQATIGYMYKW